MRRLMSEVGRTWFARTGALWTALNGRVATHFDSSARDQHRHVAAHTFAAGVVAGAFLLQWTLGSAIGGPQLWLFHVAIVLTAAYGGAAATIVATLLSVLLARLSSAVPMSTALLFGVEGLLIGLVVLRMTKVIRDLRRRLEGSFRELESSWRRATRLDGALSRLDQASEDVAVSLLDQAGCVIDWRIGATRLYGFESRDMVSTRAAALFDESGRADFPRLLAEARGATARRSCRQMRADGTMFEAEIEVSPLPADGLDGFTMIVRDLTRQQARAAADRSTAETDAQLHREVELAQRQLLTLQDLTDPTLNSLSAVQIVSELLNRLRLAIHADGIALVHSGRHPRHLFCASEGLQCQRVHQRPGAAIGAGTNRTIVIHNDLAAVAEVSAAVWPEDVSSLIAVPLLRAGSARGVVEVVNRTGRRDTEWEIALVQVVAARIAGVLGDESNVDAAARAWATMGSPSGSPFLSGSDLRPSLDERAADDRQSAEQQG
jgi:PAS domain S-box-containing protein